MNALLLFDIDGTLVDTEGAGLQALRQGFYEAFPAHRGQPFPSLDLGGATDGSIFAFLFDHFGIKNEAAQRDAFYQSYEAALEQSLTDYGAKGKGRVLSGVSQLLSALCSDFPAHTSALLTGNAESGARIKLRHYQLNEHFPFGAFGCDHADRNQLGPIAMDRAKQSTGRDFSPDEVIVIGDTPKDIACARACGAKVLAVATGAVSFEDLEKAKPDALLHDFSDLEHTISTLELLFSAGAQ